MKENVKRCEQQHSAWPIIERIGTYECEHAVKHVHVKFNVLVS